MEDFNKCIFVKIGDDVKPEDAYFDGEYPDPPLSLFENNEAAQEVTIADKGASITDIDDCIAKNGFEVKPEQNPKKKRKKKGKGRKNPRQPKNRQPIDSQSRNLKRLRN